MHHFCVICKYCFPWCYIKTSLKYHKQTLIFIIGYLYLRTKKIVHIVIRSTSVLYGLFNRTLVRDLSSHGVLIR